MLRLYAFLTLSLFHSSVDDSRAEQLIKQMYDRYHGKWFETFTFVQTTERYRNDSLIQTSTWYEAVSYPDKFRIDFGDLKNGNAVIFRKDSVFNFQNGQLKNKGKDQNDLTFLLGGLYFYPLGKVYTQLKSLHYDLGKFREDEWKGKPVFVIGASSPGEKTNQLWIDKEKLILVRMIKYDDNRKEEGIFGDHIQAAGGWSETSAVFYINDKLIQKEYYKDCRANPSLDSALFEPDSFGKWHWYH
jgi:hypothetical protein